MLVPFVKEFRILPKRGEEYQRRLYRQVKALPIAEVDELLSAERKQLEADGMEYVASGDEPSVEEKATTVEYVAAVDEPSEEEKATETVGRKRRKTVE